jgi:hypothetical protein
VQNSAEFHEIQCSKFCGIPRNTAEFRTKIIHGISKEILVLLYIKIIYKKSFSTLFQVVGIPTFGDMDPGRGHGNMDEVMETWTRTSKHGRGHGNMDEDMETWKRTWKQGREQGNIGKNMETFTMTWKH